MALAREAHIAEDSWDRPCHGLSPPARLRLRLARALALDPQLLLLEHPSATLERGDVLPFGRDVRAVCRQRGLTAITLTMDRELAGAAATRTLTLEPATGRLKEGLLARMGFRS
jgi:energy-coupling factor transporter ATP-binding protein EcfA2